MLKEGSTIAVVAPAALADMGRVARGIALLREWGYRIREGHYLSAASRYNAGTVEQRSEDLNAALSDPGIDCVWLVRGGYGCVHCLPHLPDSLPRDRMVIGFSDATSLFCALYGRGHFNLVHGPMIEYLGGDVDESSRYSLRALLTGDKRPAMMGQHVAGPTVPVTAPLIGGNLATLSSIAGTPWSIGAAGKIVLIEEITETAYRMDRMVMQLLASGFFDGVKGIVLGDFIRCTVPNGSGYTVEEVLVDLLAHLGVPIIKGVGVGHGSRNLSWIYGEQVTLRDGTVLFEPGR